MSNSINTGKGSSGSAEQTNTIIRSVFIFKEELEVEAEGLASAGGSGW